MLFGRRSSTNILRPFHRKEVETDEEGSSTERSENEIPEGLDRPPTPPDMYMVKEESMFRHIIIRCDNPYKSYFDAFILALVGYSCLMALYNSAFTASRNKYIVIWDWIVEGSFWADLILNFLHSFRDPETLNAVEDITIIAKNYFYGWFIVDFLACFPFQVMFKSGIMLKLVRLARMPRLIKLLDESRFKRVLTEWGGPKPSIQEI